MSSDILDKRPHVIPCIIAALMLFLALGRWPYAYYQILRFVVCSIGAYVAVIAYSWKKLWATWLFGIIAILFNPLIPIHLSRELWQPTDMISGVLFLVIGCVLKEPCQ